MQVALIGLTQSGKSSVFSAVTEGHVHAGAGAAHLTDQAVVSVPDDRLVVLTEAYKPKKTVPATIDFLDLPGLTFTDEPGRHEARRVIAQARQADMLLLVVRGFTSDSVAAYRNRVDPAGDLNDIHNEFMLADLELIANRIEKLEKSAQRPTKNPEHDKHELALLQRCQDTIENEKPLSHLVENPEEEKMLRSFGFLTLKPTCVVVNVDEDKFNQAPAISTEATGGLEPVALCATLEAELAALDPDERSAFLADLGIEQIARDRLIRTCYRALNVVSFLTVGADEVRAWTVPAQCPAVEAAGQVHSDIQRGFIRAAVVRYDDFIAAGDMKGAKAAGKLRLEGKAYPVQDGDIIDFRFNV